MKKIAVVVMLMCVMFFVVHVRYGERTDESFDGDMGEGEVSGARSAEAQLETERTIFNNVWNKANQRLMTTPGVGAQGSLETSQTILNNVWDRPNNMLRTSGGDLSSSATGSYDGEDVFFSGTTGKIVRRGTCAPPIVNVKACGAIGNGVADDTTAIQTALDLFGDVTDVSGVILFPQGTYKITQTLTYAGAPGLGLRITGELGPTRGPSGTLISWAGASGGTMMYLTGLNGATIERLEFLGGGLAKIGVWIDSLNNEVPGSAGSAFNVMRGLTFGGIEGTDSAAILFAHAHALTMQVSEIHMSDIFINGDPNTWSLDAGIKTLETGNTKNFSLETSMILGCKYGIDWQEASGYFTVRGVNFGINSLADVRIGGANMHLDSVTSESGTGRFVTGTTGVNAGALVITNSTWQSAPGADDVIIEYSGQIVLQGNTFYNYRTETSWPIIKVAGDTLMTTTTSGASLVSLGNWYRRAPAGYGPFMDGSGNELLGRTTYYNDKTVAVTSLGDTGGIGGNIYHLENWVPKDAVQRVPPRVTVMTDAATVTPNIDIQNVGVLSTLSQATLIANPTGTPQEAQAWLLRITSASAQTLTWGGSYASTAAVALPTATTGGGAVDYFTFRYNAVTTKYELISKTQ